MEIYSSCQTSPKGCRVRNYETSSSYRGYCGVEAIMIRPSEREAKLTQTRNLKMARSPHAYVR
ncbi:MAG: hypothetical protein FJX39_01995, partial [Alphaproteobacteria bacterium]|nr:hypothetical protein [Alphaproteobacteria bacterium]